MTVDAYSNAGVIEFLFEERAKVIPYIEPFQFFEFLLIFDLDDPDHLGAVYSDLQEKRTPCNAHVAQYHKSKCI